MKLAEAEGTFLYLPPGHQDQQLHEQTSTNETSSSSFIKGNINITTMNHDLICISLVEIARIN